GTREKEGNEEEVGKNMHGTLHLFGEQLDDTVEKEVSGIIKDLVEHEVERSAEEVGK
ncbi:hypothetical protein KI387_033513, partial [Taxus chinensis]